MASNHRQAGDGGSGGSAQRRPPEWADGLKQLYDSVVEEALPDSFKDLLDRLDEIDPARSRNAGNDDAPPQGRGTQDQ
ncbi:MAG: NepR family anti-sigma factor [Porphyrobacter sp.]|nr:NepR family anti-sigma factor [Porphyrobacter sp.]